VTESVSPVLAAWSSFYVMTGSSAAALTGLMFVVITLVKGEERLEGARDGTATFSTPTVVHLGTALLISALLCAPWPSAAGPAVVLGLIGLAGVAYVLRVMRRTQQFTGYDPDLDDWIWYAILPFVAYTVILAAAIAFFTLPADAPFAVAAGVLFLIFIAIRNAWDMVTYIATGGPNRPPPAA